MNAVIWYLILVSSSGQSTIPQPSYEVCHRQAVSYESMLTEEWRYGYARCVQGVAPK